MSLSFTFTKKIQNNVIRDSKIRDASTRDDEEERDFVQSVVGTEIKGTLKKIKAKKEELVIPLIAKNNWRVDREKREKAKNKVDPIQSIEDGKIGDELEKQAIKEILESIKPKEVSNEEEEEIDPNVPLLLQNRIPDGYEEDSNMDVSLRPDIPTIEDYERIPIDQFGMAMLRGMGWKKDEGIGLKNKKVVQMLEPQLRPKGLGLGAERPQNDKALLPQSSGKKDEENLTLKIGAFALITKGSNNGYYGQIGSFDEDNNRVILKLAINSKMAAVSKFNMSLVTEKEYKSKSKILNNEKYEKYKKMQEEKDGHREIGDAFGSRLDSTTGEPPEKKSKKDKKHKKKEESRNRGWIRPNLRVRFIDEKYQKGRYYEKKFVIEDVFRSDECVLRDDHGGILDKIREKQLETVIPRGESSNVCILRGKYRGQVGEIVQRDKKKCEAIIQLLPDRDPIIEMHFDDICEYVGDV